MGIRVYNTLGRRLQDLAPRETGIIAMYVCGPTVQAAPHAGHGRQAVAFDVIRRYMEWRGFDVTYVANVTDVEDKIIAAALEEGIDASEVASRSATLFFAAYERLRVAPYSAVTYATAHIPEMIDMVERLVTNGHAYESEGDVYFAVRSMPGYGKLSGRNIDDLLSGARVEPGEQKRDPLDFALWKASKPGEPVWDSPWGPGRPGWHIECSAMAEKELGFGFDIHGGGDDLVFPHHENEIAQAEGAAGTEPFAQVWLHNGMLNLRGEKMSKSEGNVVGLKELLERHRPEAVRLFYLRAHYRHPVEFGSDLLDDAVAGLERLWAFRRRSGPVDDAPDQGAIVAFTEAMDDDFNTPRALAVLFEAVREGNRLLDAGEDAGPLAAAYDEIAAVFAIDEPADDLEDVRDALEALGAEFGVDGVGPDRIVERLVEARSTARDDRAFEVADRIRDGLAEAGIVLEDGADGTSWHRS